MSSARPTTEISQDFEDLLIEAATYLPTLEYYEILKDLKKEINHRIVSLKANHPIPKGATA